MKSNLAFQEKCVHYESWHYTKAVTAYCQCYRVIIDDLDGGCLNCPEFKLSDADLKWKRRAKKINKERNAIIKSNLKPNEKK